MFSLSLQGEVPSLNTPSLTVPCTPAQVEAHNDKMVGRFKSPELRQVSLIFA